jgi:hypothetical protein
MRITKLLFSVAVVIVGIFVANQMMRSPVPTHEAGPVSRERIATPETVKHPALSPAVGTSTPAPLLAEQATNADTRLSPETKLEQTPLVTPVSVPASTPKEPLRDPEARAAMSLVGIDPDAEAYWLGAIFDSSLPENEREDLMEDLNEEGLSDAKHPGPQDLPVILNRLVIIEEILPFADEFMVEHLGEAYKDLLNLADVTQGRGEPVH